MCWRLNIVLTAILIAGCSSKLIVRSDPTDAEVFTRSPGAQEKNPIGKTPLEISTSDLERQTKISSSSGDYFELIVEKPNFQTDRILVPASRLGSMKTVISAKLIPGAKEGSIASALVQNLFNAQTFLSHGEYERALIEVDKAIALDPNFARAYSMKGSIYFLQHNYAESLTWYEKALQKDPQIEDAIKMISFIKKKKNGDASEREPAGDGN